MGSQREPQIILKTASEAFPSSYGATENFTGESNNWHERRVPLEGNKLGVLVRAGVGW